MKYDNDEQISQRLLSEMADQVEYLIPMAHSVSRVIVALQAAEYKARFPYE